MLCTFWKNSQGWYQLFLNRETIPSLSTSEKKHFWSVFELFLGSLRSFSVFLKHLDVSWDALVNRWQIYWGDNSWRDFKPWYLSNWWLVHELIQWWADSASNFPNMGPFKRCVRPEGGEVPNKAYKSARKCTREGGPQRSYVGSLNR